MQKDGYLVKHLFDQNLIDRRTYESIIAPVPPIVPPISVSRGRHSSHHSHRRLPQVEEEDAVSGSSSRHHHSSHRRDPSHRSRSQVEEEEANAGFSSTQRHRHLREPKRTPRRDHGSKHRRDARREHSCDSSSGARRNQEDLGRLTSAPAVDYSGYGVPKPDRGHGVPTPDPGDGVPTPQLVRRARSSSPYSSTKMSENTHPRGSTLSSRTASRKHDEHRSVRHAGDKTATNTVAHDLNKVDNGLMRKRNRDPSSRVESPQSQDRSNIAPSNCSTDTSTPDSGSFVLAEYSEEENKKLDDDHPFVQFRGVAITSIFEAFRSWSGNDSEQETPCDGVDEPDPAPNESKGKGKDSETGKRKWADQSQSNKTRNNSSGPSSNRAGCSKRRRTSDRPLTFACPYTKKDPMSYRDCYKYKLSRIRDVKQHLVRCHRYPLYCPRCMGTFQTEDERDGHIREFTCPSRPWIKLDGITDSQGRQLSKKSASNISSEEQWFAVFDIVFPGHEPRPQSPYIDSELLQDITLYQEFLTSNGPRILSETLTQRGVMTWMLPNEERNLEAFQQTVFEEGLSIIFEQWLARRSSSGQGSSVPSGSGSTGQGTPPSSLSSRERATSSSVHGCRDVAPESSGSRLVGGPIDAQLGNQDVHGDSSGQIPLIEGLDGSFNLGNGNSEFLSEFTYNGSDDELTQLFTDS